MKHQIISKNTHIMKKTTLFIVVSVFFLVSSCIPSLHPIVNEENRVTDDRLVGDWKMEEDIFASNFEFNIETDDEKEKQEGLEMIKELGAGMKGFFGNKKNYSLWKFERAATITAVDKKKLKDPKGPGLEATFNSWVTSLVPKNLTIIERKDLPYYILTYKKANGKEEWMKVELTKINGATYMDVYPLNVPEEGRFGVNYINAHTFAKVEIKSGKLLISSFNILEIEKLLKTKKIRLKHEIVPYARFNDGNIDYEDNIVLTASTTELRAFIAKYSDNEALFEEAEELTVYNEKNP